MIVDMKNKVRGDGIRLPLMRRDVGRTAVSVWCLAALALVLIFIWYISHVCSKERPCVGP
jgi:hypothetical protein